MPKKNTFSTDKQPKKRKPRGKDKRTLILEAMERQGKTQESFYDMLIERSFNLDDNFAFKEVLTRMYPVPKAVAPLVEFDFPKKEKPHAQAAHVLEAVSKGVIPSDVGKMFIESISSMLKIQEITDFEERLKAIEDASKQS